MLRERGQDPENARPVGRREAGAEAQTLVKGPRGAALSSAHRFALLVNSAYDLALTGRAPSAVTAFVRHATALIWAVFVAPRAPCRLADPGRPLVELVVLLASAVGLGTHKVAAAPRLGTQS